MSDPTAAPSSTEGRLPAGHVPPRTAGLSQDQTPYLDALCAHAAAHPGRYNVPAHKGNAKLADRLAAAYGDRVLVMDIPPIIDGIDAGPQPTPFEQAQQLAAEAWKARRTWFLGNGASSANHAICLALAQMGGEIVVQRNVHTSTIDGIITAGLQPTFAYPQIDPQLGIAHCLVPEELDRALSAATRPTAAIVVSPTYYGFSADLVSLKRVADAHGVALIVDEAWGSHFAFSDRLPTDAISAGADLVVSSTHKMLGSLTQSAMLHAGANSAIDDAIVDRAVSLLESTSPSALLHGSLDAARRHAAVDGATQIGRTVDELAEVRAQVGRLPGLDVLGDGLIGSFGIAGFDPLHLAIDVSRSGRAGGDLNRHLNHANAIFIELISERVLVAIFGIGETAADASGLIDGLRDALEVVAPSSAADADRAFSLPEAGELVMTPQRAYFSPAVAVGFPESVGRIAAESIAVYPPGSPNVLPGERITRMNVDHVLGARARGLAVRGPVDRSLQTVRVVDHA